MILEIIKSMIECANDELEYCHNSSLVEELSKIGATLVNGSDEYEDTLS